jgi:hypothetical protein
VDFAEFEVKVRRAKKTKRFVQDNTTTLCFDPGHTTGYAVFRGLELVEWGELVTKPIETAAEVLNDMIHMKAPHIIVMESYRVYKWKAKHHGGSELLTARVIGCIETLAVIHFVPNIIKQPAHIAKAFCTNQRLKQWGFYDTGARHANDAIRHGCHFLLFGAINQKEAKGMTVG